MSEEKKEDDSPEAESGEETGNETLSAGKDNNSGADEKPVNSDKKSGKKKWVFILPIIIVVLLGTFFLGLKFMPENFRFLFKKDVEYGKIIIDEEKLSEEALSPFFIPPGPENKTIRIDLIIVWDSLASIRFRKNELVIRNMIYERFYEIAQKHKDLNAQISYLENEVSIMLRKSLGVQNLIVRIKEIRYF